MDQNNRKFLFDSFAGADLSLSDIQIDQFMRYFEYLTEKNKVVNLTAITDYTEVVYKHFLDSVLIAKVFDINKCESVLDVGTGAGFPGIPLKIVFPDLQILLLDSLNKRVIFLNEVIEMLGLKNITAIHDRAEDAAHNCLYREKFDLCVSREVANLSTLSEYCIPFVKQGGFFVSYKSSEIEQECENAKKAVTLLGGRIHGIKKCVIPGTEMERSFVIIKKEKGTSSKYPRKAGTPVKSPLGL